jgi:hypothetical protein
VQRPQPQRPFRHAAGGETSDDDRFRPGPEFPYEGQRWAGQVVEGRDAPGGSS